MSLSLSFITEPGITADIEVSRTQEDPFLVLDKLLGNNLFLIYSFFPMTTMNGQIKNFTSNFGPQHPTAHGVSRSILEMNGEVVERAEPHIGSLQCGTKPLTLSRLLCRLLCPACLVPRHGGGPIARHEHRDKGRLSNSSEPPYLTTT
ncbi:hypothetical protein PHAVU_011G124215 [Phaseolus vulgaris]